MIIVASYDDVKTGFPVFPTGFHNAKIADVTIERKDGGNEQFVVSLVGNSEESRDRTIKDFISIVPAMLWKFKALLKVTGWPEGAKFDTHEPECVGTLFDKNVRIQVIEEEHNGKRHRKVKSYYDVESDVAKIESSASTKTSNKPKMPELTDDDMNF